MSSNSQKIKSENRTLWPVVSVIFFGALGSGLWEFFLRDFSYFLLRWVTSIADVMFTGFADSFYSNVGKATNPLFTVLVPILVIVLLILVPWITTFRYYLQTSENVDELEVAEQKFKRYKFFAVFFPAISVIITLLYGHILVADIHNFKSSNYLDRTIEILRPHIATSKYYELRSEFRQVETRDQFENLYIKLNNIGYQKEVWLPEFRPLMIDKKPNKALNSNKNSQYYKE